MIEPSDTPLPSAATTSPTDHGPMSIGDALDRLFGPDGIEAWLDRLASEDEAHRSACATEYCDPCGRYPCAGCRRAVVGDAGRRCLDCHTRDAVQSAGVPRRYADALGATEHRVRCASARHAAHGAIDARNVLLVGGAGKGKSTLAAAMLATRVRQTLQGRRSREAVLWTGAIDLALARSQHRLGEGEAELVERAMRADVLVVDDLGAEPTRDADVVIAILHRRHDAELTTWVTSGLTAAQLRARYGGGVERRLVEGATVIQCGAGR